MGIFIQDIEPTLYVGNESNISGYCEEYMVYPSSTPHHDYSQDYLIFKALESGTFSFTNDVDYSIDSGATWTTLTANTASPSIASGSTILWKAQLTPNSSSGIGTFSSTGQYEVEGNAMSLLFDDNFIGKTDFQRGLIELSYAFIFLFSGSTKLTSAENLSLPATTLSNQCYRYMFRGCTSLVTAPELPATTMTIYCYDNMFNGCSSLTTAPELHATTLASNCYTNMFYGCTSLTSTPVLNADILAQSCCSSMFRDCSSLTNAPVLSATTLASNCYTNMFRGCTSLTTAPELPATTLEQDCYQGMFNGCSSLTTAPELPATTLAQGCYSSMFFGCSSLTTAPDLSATSLPFTCYLGMFNGCSSLTTAPELPATRLSDSCYRLMFNGCANLNYIKMLATDISAQNCLLDWVSGVSATGTFVKDANMTTLPTGNSGIPNNWTVVDNT